MNTMMRKADRALLNESELPVALYLELEAGTFVLKGEATSFRRVTVDIEGGKISRTAAFINQGVELEIRVSYMQSHVVPQMFAIDVICNCKRGMEQIRQMSFDLLYPFFYNGFQVLRTYVEELEQGRTGLFAELKREGQEYMALSILKNKEDVEVKIAESGRNPLTLLKDGSVECRQYFILLPAKEKKKDKQEAIRLMCAAATLPFEYWQEQQRMYLKQQAMELNCLQIGDGA